MPERPKNNPAPSLQAPLNHNKQKKLKQLRVKVAYLKKLQALLKKKSTSKRKIKRRS